MTICIDKASNQEINKPMKENKLSLLEMESLPREVFVRQQYIPAQHFFPAHTHNWHQLLYATSGVLTVDVVNERLFISPEKAVWLPMGCEHSVSTAFGAELKSLYIDASYQQLDTKKSLVLEISALLKSLVIEASSFEINYSTTGYEQQVISLILSSLPRLAQDKTHLPWPTSTELYHLCTQLYNHPEGRYSTAILAKELNVSKRTLERRFIKETGKSLQAWCLRLRFLKAIELLNTNQSITRIALELGYSSPSPFIYMFRAQSGVSPGQYLAESQRNSTNSLKSN